MGNSAFKSVAFGGFDKQDVIRYIEQNAKEASEVQTRLTEENQQLSAEVTRLSAETTQLQEQLEEAIREREELRVSLEQELSRRQVLEPLEEEVGQMKEEIARLRPDAESYLQFRDRLGIIECEARKRAADLEQATIVKLEGLLRQVQAQYQTSMQLLEATAGHVTGELRKVEVNLTQLPRSMDRVGAELSELSAAVQSAKNEIKK